MISARRKGLFTGMICLAIASFAFVTPSYAQVHNCTLESAEDRTGEAAVVLNWFSPHSRCVIVSPGTTVTWNGNFGTHPLAGGVSPTKDTASPISSSNDNIGSVKFNLEGTYPYFCRVHRTSMRGVIYVRPAVPEPGAFDKSTPADDAMGQSTSPILDWDTSTDATSYEYCIDQSLNSSCDDAWTSVGANTQAALDGLPNDATHEWQARAVNDTGNTEANGGAWWQFTTVVAAPEGFTKTNPTDNAVDQSTAPTLEWTAGAGATEYEYCIDTSDNNTCNDVWTSTGIDTSAALAGLTEDTDHFWQARATNDGGTTEADGEVWWQFTTVVTAPLGFAKTSPPNNAAGQPGSLTLDWTVSAGATKYEYCIDTTDNDSCDGAWTSTGLNTGANLVGLDADTAHFWQARATNAGGTTESDGGTWWQFKTQVAKPSAFSKSTPSNGAIGQSTAPILDWPDSAGATSYEYCIDQSLNSVCNGVWIGVGAATEVSLSGLPNGVAHHWQVRAVNVAGNTEANGGIWWQFTTVVAAPGEFSKTGPADNSIDQSTISELTWAASAQSSSYEYCIDSTDNSACDTSWISTGKNTKAALANLPTITTYHWHARAINNGGTTEANGGAWWSFTTSVFAEAIFEDSFESGPTP
jgi:plastocyanin